MLPETMISSITEAMCVMNDVILGEVEGHYPELANITLRLCDKGYD